MHDDRAAEIRELRQRVFGAGGDLQGDEQAHARLAELVGRAAADPVGPPNHRQPPDAARPTAASAPPPAIPADTLPPAAGPGTATAKTSSTSGRRRLITLAWVASLILAAVVGGLAASWQRELTGSEVAFLPFSAANPLPEWAQDRFSPGATATVDFHGVTLVRLPPNISAPQADGGCLQVVPTARTGRAQNSVLFGCGAGPFPASIPVRVAVTGPADLREAFPVGTTLRFVVEGDVVRVYSVAP